MDRFDVMIVGMGPVGATLACLLGRAGLSVAMVDRELGIYDKPRAIVLDHEALRILQFCGVDQSFFDGVSPHTGTDFVGVEGQLIKLFDPKAPPFELGWDPNVTFIQPELEEALAKVVERLPTVETHRGWNVTDIRQTSDEAIVEAVDQDGKRHRMVASWVIGADGANSIVRETAGLPLDDKDFAEWWMVVDAWLTGQADLPRKTTQYCQPKRPATYVVGPRNLRRWEIKLMPGEDPAAFRDDARVLEVLANYVDVDALDLWRTAVYRFRAAVARQWRKGRLLIAGDAAHTMPPFLAQGLCAGMRDAGNLAWKLVQVQRHGATADLLDSYEHERKPHVSQIIDHAKEFGLIIGELDTDRAAVRDMVLTEQLRSGAVPTERQAFVPDLEAGLIDVDAPGAGSLFVQPLIARADGEVSRMDDVTAPDFLVVARDAASLALDDELAQAWRAIGGRRLVLDGGAVSGDVAPLGEVDGTVSDWLAQHGAVAAVVRPDRYVYGLARDASDVTGMVRSITNALAVTQSGSGSAPTVDVVHA